MSDRIVPRGLMSRGGPAPSGHLTAQYIKPSAPIGAMRLPDSGFDEMDFNSRPTRSHGLLVPQNGSPFQGGDDTTTDNAAKTEFRRADSGIYSGDLDKSMQSLSISHLRSQPTHIHHVHPSSNNTSRFRRPTAGQAKTTRIVEMSKSNNSSTVQAPSLRSNSPSLTYSSTQPSYGQYPSSYSTPMQHYPTYTQPQQQQHFVDVRSMLQENLHLFMQDKEGDTGLHLAVIHSQPDVLDRLLYLMTKEPMLQAVIDEQNALYQTALHLAVHTQQIDMIRKLLLSGASLNVPDHKGNTALHIAAQFSSTKSLEELALYVPMQTLLEVATTRNNEGQTCVHVAAQYGNTDVLRKLKSYGVNIDMQDHKSGRTALHLSVENSSLRDVQFLLETCHADVNATTFTGCTCLHIAAGRGDISTAAYLLSQGANPDLKTDEGDTALEIAGSDEVNSLLSKAAALKWIY